MFDMRQNAGGNAGYELRISYNKDMNKFFVSGYVIFMDGNNRMRYDRDGASLQFTTMEAAIEHITNYPESLGKLAGL